MLATTHLPVETRVRDRLARLVSTVGGEPPITLLLTQEDLASLAGTTRPTVNRILRELVADGIVRLGRGRIVVIDPGRVAGRCRTGP